jgi:UDP-2,3-diacylglucosamine hydrolase
MHVFISDAHIRIDASHRAKMLQRFLTDIRSQVTDLYVLGDLFEFWFEYGVVFPKNYFKTLAALYNLVQNGINVHFLLGNHEIVTGDFLENFGFIVHPYSIILTIDGKDVFMTHGHRIDRRLWTTVLQNLMSSKLNHTLYRFIHPDIGVFLAQGIAHLSRKQRTNPHLINVFEKYAQEKLREVDIVILAHSHVPAIRKFPNDKYYLNTGDWIKHFSYGVIDDGQVSLCYYKP